MSHIFGRRPIGVCQPPGNGSDYPFVAPSADVALLLADFYLSYRDDASTLTPPLRLAWLHGFGTEVVLPPSGFSTPTHDYDLVVVDALGSVVFDSTEATSFTVLPWAGRLLIIEWRSDEQVCRCTIHTEWHADQTPTLYDTYITPDAGELDARTYNRLPLRLRSLSTGLYTLTGDLRLEAGYNVKLEAESLPRVDGQRFVNRITLNGTPGAGLGQLPGCDSTTVLLRTINGIAPDVSGNFRIEFDSCFRAQIPLQITDDESGRTAAYGWDGLTAQQAEAAMILFDDCTPCCTCDDFVAAYRALKVIWQRWKEIANQAEEARDTLRENRERWLRAYECAMLHPARLVGLAEPLGRNFIGGAYCNTTDCCLTSVELRFTVQLFDHGAADIWNDSQLVEALGQSSSLDGEQPVTPDIVTTAAGAVFRFFFDFADPQSSTVVRTKLCGPVAATNNLNVTFTVHGVAVEPDPSGRTCVVDDALADVPISVRNIWTTGGVPTAHTLTVLTKNFTVNPNAPVKVCCVT